MNIQQGQRIKLSDLTPSLDFQVEINFEMTRGEGDISCFGVDASGKLSDDRYFIFYNQLQAPKDALVMSQSGQKTSIRINLQALPNEIEKLVFTLSTDAPFTMKDIRQGSLSLWYNGKSLAQFDFNGNNFDQQKAIILAEIYKKSDIWRISPVANGFNGGLSALLAFFGGEEIVPDQPVPEIKKSTPLKVSTTPKPAPVPAPEPPSAVNLKKSGDSHKINLVKNSGTIHVNLNWNKDVKTGLFATKKAIDLDLACMFRLKTGEQGVIQALGNAFGSDSGLPFIKLDHDDRTGSSNNGENMFFSKPELLDFVVVFAYIYEGAQGWQGTKGVVTLTQENGSDITISLDEAKTNQRFCVVASMTNTDGQLIIKREELYFNGHREVDQHYGFGFRWSTGHK